MAVSFHPPPRRILVRSVNWLGDAVMTTPALLRLRDKYPGTHISLLTPAKLRDLWPHHLALDKVIAFDKGDGLFAVSQKLRAGQFDLALVLPNSPRAAMETWLAGIPQRIGYERPWRNWFLTRAIPTRPGHGRMRKRTAVEIDGLIERKSETKNQKPEAVHPSVHQIHEYLHLAAALGVNPEPIAPQLAIKPDEIESARKKFGLETTSTPILALNPGAEYGPAKRWPVARFIAAAREIQQRTNCVWLILGGSSDSALAAEISSALGPRPLAVHNLAGRTSLRDLMALLKICRVLLTNDTGPMHVAAALGTPVVVPFGSTSPELTGPGLPGDPRHRLMKSDAPCAPCFLRECPIDFRCLNGISSDRAVAAVLEVVQAGHRA